MRRPIRGVRVVLALVGALASFSTASADESLFLKPVRLQADGVDIDTGENGGHSGPCVADVDGDGLRDLVVGDYSGKFRFYKNVGSAIDPKYTAAGNLQAADADAEVPIYCCIGSSPFFVDFDNDGKPDFISGSYDPGGCYLFRGLGAGKFAKRRTLTDKSGKPILRCPDQKDSIQSFGSWPVMVDWNADGKLDLLIGTFDGTMFVRLNEWIREKPKFSADNLVVRAAGKELELPGKDSGHAAPAVVDWDGDGLWDILSGYANGGVYFYRNVGEAGFPRFDPPQVLIAPHEGSGRNEILEVGADPVPGVRTQIFAVDYFGSGKTDLLVGDVRFTVTPRTDLTPAEREDLQSLRKKYEEVDEQRGKRHQALMAEFTKRYPGNAFYSKEASTERADAFLALRDSPDSRALDHKSRELRAAIANYLVKPPSGGGFNPYETTQGYVWLFRRK